MIDQNLEITQISQRKKLLKSLKELGLSAQIHGIPRIISNKYWILKSIWILSFLASTSVCFYFLHKSLKSYFDYSYVTNINIVDQNPMIFPTITICSQKPPIKDYNLSDIIISCFFDGIDCSIEPFFIKSYNQTYSIKSCYQFNSGFNNSPLLSSYRSGSYLGLKLELFEGLFNEERFEMFNITVNTGFQIFIHNKSEFISNVNEISIKPGEATFISLRKVVTEKLTEPYNNCIKDLSTYHSFDSSLYNEIVSSNYKYSQRGCYDYSYLKTFNCVTSFSRFYQDCNLTSDFIQDLFNKFYIYFKSKTYLKYQDQCPLECDTISFKTRISQTYYPSYDEYRIFLKNKALINKFPSGVNTSIEELRKSVYYLQIYYEDLGYIIVSQEPKLDLWDLVSSFGGLLGLFLGFSFLSLIDLVQIIFTLFLYFYN